MKRISKTNLALITATLFVISGCLGNGVETAETKGIKHITPIIPGIVLGAPSDTLMKSTDSATILISISDAVDATLTAADIDSLVTGTANCTIGVTNLTDTTARINLSSCSGDGTFRVFVKAGAVVSTTNTPNDASSNSAAITIDNTAPRVLSFTPPTGPVATMPTSLVITFSEPVDPADVIAGNILIDATGIVGGACTVPPTFSSRLMSSGNTVATVTLTPATCTDGQGARIRVNITSIQDDVGNNGTSTSAATRSYTFTDGPTVDFDPAWSRPLVNVLSAATTLGVDFQAGNTNVTVPTINSTSVGVVTVSGNAVCGTLSGTAVTANGATINLSNCSGDGTIAVNIKAGVLETASGIANVLSANSATFEVDNTGPLLTSLTPATSTVGTMPTVRAVYNDSMTLATVTSTDVVITGTCSVLPTVNTITPSVNDTTFDITFTGGTCNDTETLIISMNGNTATDAAGNTGLASALSRTYTFDTSGPTLSSFTPASATVNSMPANLQATFSQALLTTSMTTADFAQSGTCGTPPTKGAIMFSGSDTIATSTLTGGSCANNETLIYTLNPAGVTDVVGNAGTGGAVVRTFTFDTVGPTISSFTPASADVTSMPSSLVVTFSEAVNTGSVTAGDMVRQGSSTCATPPTVNAPMFSGGNTIATFNLTGGSCNEDETLVYALNASGVTDVVGNAGSGTSTRTYRLDTTGPTVLVTGVNATNAMNVTATFDEPVLTMSVVKFTVGGTCSTPPVIAGGSFNAVSSTVYTIDLDDTLAVCGSGETVTVSVDASTVTDNAGNAGTGINTDTFIAP